MNCNQIKNLLTLYINNELDEEILTMVNKHFSKCSDCKKTLEDMKDIINAYNNIEEYDLPDNFRLELNNKLIIANNENNRNRKIRYIKVFSAIAAILMLLMITKISIDKLYQNNNLSVQNSQITKHDFSNTQKYNTNKSSDNTKILQSQPTQTEAQTNSNILKDSKSSNTDSKPKADSTLNSKTLLPPESKPTQQNIDKFQYKTASLDLKTGNINDTEFDIRTIASSYGQELETPQQFSATESLDVRQSIVTLEFKIENSKFLEFINAFKSKYGNMSTPTISSIDMKTELDKLNAQLEQVNTNIISNKSGADVEKLEQEKQKIQQELNEMTLNSNYVFTKITISDQ